MASSAKGGPWKVLFGVTFFLLGPCLLAAALISAYRTHAFLSTSEAAEATVIRLQEFWNLNHTTASYAPVFTFAAGDGRAYTVTSNMATNPPVFKVGEHAQAHYPKGHPEQARLDSFSQLWLMDVANEIIGSIFTLLLLALFFARKGTPRIYSRTDFPEPGATS
jgi:hypothetical protein